MLVTVHKPCHVPHASRFFFFFRLFYLSTRFLFVLALEIFCHPLTNLFPSFYCFLCFFGCYECWLPAEAVSCATCLADNNFRNVSKKWVRSWSHTKNYNGNSKAFCVKRNTIKRKKNSRNNNSDRKIIMTQNVFSLIPQTWESVYYALIETS